MIEHSPMSHNGPPPGARPWSRVMWSQASQVFALYEPAPETRETVAADLAPAAAAARLLADEALSEACAFMAQALPRFEAIQWAYACVRETAPQAMSDLDRMALDAVGRWLADSSEELRRRCGELALAGGPETPETFCAISVFWSGGSLAPPDAPPVAPARGLAGMGVNATIQLAAARLGGAKVPPMLRRFLAAGEDMAAGGPGAIPEDDPGGEAGVEGVSDAVNDG